MFSVLMFTFTSRLGWLCSSIVPVMVSQDKPAICMFSVLENDVTCLDWSAARVITWSGDSAAAEEWWPGLELLPQPAASTTAAPAAAATETLVRRERIEAFP